MVDGIIAVRPFISQYGHRLIHDCPVVVDRRRCRRITGAMAGMAAADRGFTFRHQRTGAGFRQADVTAGASHPVGTTAPERAGVSDVPPLAGPP